MLMKKVRFCVNLMSGKQRCLSCDPRGGQSACWSLLVYIAKPESQMRMSALRANSEMIRRPIQSPLSSLWY